jgi:ADP-ribose pyrophosphatase YjhB (NUDIX family)
VTDALDAARALFRAVNDEDLPAVVALYHPQCISEHVFSDADAVVRGRDAIAGAWEREFAERSGALPGGYRYDVTRIGGIETGWGWARAEWARLTRERGDGSERAATGYSHFWIEDGLIRRHRTIAHAVAPALIREPRPESARRYPSRPLVGVGAVVLSAAGEVLLVKRKHEPLAGQWSLPGGMLELGESLEAGVARELLEETGLHVSVGRWSKCSTASCLMTTARSGITSCSVDYLCRVRGGELAAGSDVDAAAWVHPSAMEAQHMTEKARSVILKALQFPA